MATYAFMSIEKIKTIGNLQAKYVHNRRIADVANADPAKRDKNESLVALPIEDGRELTYARMFRDRIASIPYYQHHKVRADQVLAYEVVLSYTKDETIDVEEWKKANLRWFHDTFVVAGDGKSNLVNVEFHGDESGNVHIHAIVIPIDERGHLNAKRFTNGSAVMSAHQTSYGEYMAPLGLKRGVAGSSAEHQKIRKLYADLNNVMKIPEIAHFRLLL